MWHKIAVAGATGAAVLGVGVAALAASGSPTTGSGTSGNGAHHRGHAGLRHALHGQVTVRRDGAYLVRSGVRGTVSAVSATSISVRAEDGFTATYTVTKDTTVRERGPARGKGGPGTLSEVHAGDDVAVLGSAPARSTADPSAKVIVDGLR